MYMYRWQAPERRGKKSGMLRKGRERRALQREERLRGKKKLRSHNMRCHKLRYQHLCLIYHRLLLLCETQDYKIYSDSGP